MSEALILYTRDQCGLCEAAAEMAAAAGIAVHPVDISGDLGLLIRYRETIPVIRDSYSGAEINWPFDAAELVQFSRRCAIPAEAQKPK